MSKGLNWWRVGILALLAVLVGGPSAATMTALATEPSGWCVWDEAERFGALARTSVLLMGGTIILALPIGTLLAVLLYRTDLPGRTLLRRFLLVALFVPLPLYASAWQATLGSGGWLALPAWTTPSQDDPDVAATGIAWKPWAVGLFPAVWVHALAALPWVVLIAGTGLRWVEAELEEDALLAAGPWRVLGMVTWPRSRAALLAAGLWVALQPATEMTVTDMMQVRTFAEEIYTQLIVGDAAAIARGVALSLPVLGLMWLGVLGTLTMFERRVPAGDGQRPALVFLLGRWRWPLLVVLLGLLALLAGVPILGLIWKAGVIGWPERWSAASTMTHLGAAVRGEWRLLLRTLGEAMLTGMLTAGLAHVICWLALEAGWFRLAAVSLLVLGWVSPAPLVGWGLQRFITLLLDGTQSAWLARVLYDGPSPLPALWAQSLRFCPVAVALLWPVVRLIPREILHTARLEGASPFQEYGLIVLPLTIRPLVRAALAVTILALGELGASKLVTPPGSETFAQVLFARMHYGVTNDLAAVCLLLLGLVGIGVAAFGFVGGHAAPDADRAIQSGP